MRASQLRRGLRRAERVVGDYQAVRNGRVPQRVGNRIIGRFVGRAMRKVWL